MGGLISLYGLCIYPEFFSKAACLSTHYPRPNLKKAYITSDPFISYFTNYIPSSNSGYKLYFDYETKTLDSLYHPYQARMDKELKLKNYSKKNEWITNRYEGYAHSEIYWRKRLSDPLLFLFGK